MICTIVRFAMARKTPQLQFSSQYMHVHAQCMLVFLYHSSRPKLYCYEIAEFALKIISDTVK